MKYSKLLIAAGLLLASTTAAIAQKIKWESGEDLAFLKDQKTINTQYIYEVTVKGEAEDVFLVGQKEELNKDKAGSGDEYVAEWTEARTKKYQPAFEKLINKKLEDDGVTVQPDAKYTIVLTTKDMKLGKGKMFVKKPALVDYNIAIVETANPSNIVAKGILEEVEGEVNAPKGSAWIPGGAGTAMAVSANVSNRDYSNRIAKAYEKAGEIIAKAIHKAKK